MHILGRSIKEVNIIGGTPGATSVYPNPAWAIKNGFARNIPTGWHNYHPYGDLPEMIWYKFRRGFVPAEVSFQPRADNAKYVFQGPNVYQFVGTNDHHCNAHSTWTVLCEDLSGYPFRHPTDVKRCVVRSNIKKRFSCLGLRIWKSGHTSAISLSNIRMWKKIN